MQKIVRYYRRKIVRYYSRFFFEKTRFLLDSYLRLKLMTPVIMPTDNEKRTISVAIPFYNNGKMSHLGLFNVLNDPRVAEIIILDDGSNRDNFSELKRKIKPFALKIKFFRRDNNLGAFANKIQAVELCSSDWVILLDYDNTIVSDYLNSIFNIDKWKENTIYCSAYAYPYFDFREELGGKTIDLDSASMMANFKKFNKTFFNDGNYFLPRERFLEHIKIFWKYSVAASDVIFANYIWLSSGNMLKVLSDAKYIHRVHGNSLWINNSEESRHVLKLIMKRIEGKISPHSECMKKDFIQVTNKWEEPTQISLH